MKRAQKLGGDNFGFRVLAHAGLTEDAYREQIRTNKLKEYAVKKAAEKELTDENYKASLRILYTRGNCANYQGGQ